MNYIIKGTSSSYCVYALTNGKALLEHAIEYKDFTSKNITPVIPGRKNRLIKIDYDQDLYTGHAEQPPKVLFLSRR
jgi:hypothetical protein